MKIIMTLKVHNLNRHQKLFNKTAKNRSCQILI